MFKMLMGSIGAALAPFLLRLAAVGGFVFFSEAIFRGYITKLQALAVSRLGGIPQEYQQLIAITGIYDAISIIFQAFFIAITIKAALALASAKASKYSQPWNGF